MVDMPMMPTGPSSGTAAAMDAALDAEATQDAPEGAFQEMLARRLGRQLVGRFAEQQEEKTGDADAGTGQWMPPQADATPSVTPVAPSRPASGTDPTAPPAPDPGRSVTPALDLGSNGTPVATPMKIHVNRPGFPRLDADPGSIQPGPEGLVWTHPSGVAELEMTQVTTPRRVVDAPLRPEGDTVPEPPIVRWSPSPARAALAAAANRDLELEVITQLMRADGQAGAAAKPQLDLIMGGAGAEGTMPGAPLDTAAIVPPGRQTASGAPADVAVSAETAAAATPVTLDAPAMSATVDAPATPVHAPQPSALVDRVLRVVELQQHLPPPRAVTVEIPEIDGLRLVVTMRMDGSVHVAPSGTGSSLNNGQVAPLLEAVNDALTERGFDMNADSGGRQSSSRHGDDEPAPPRTPRFRRSARRPGLRI